VIKNLVGSMRGVPDIAANADPASGMLVYCQPSSCGFAQSWLIFGGTSLASPLMAGMANAAGHFRNGSASQAAVIYSLLASVNYPANYNDTKLGTCSNGTGGAAVNAVKGWDRCTGVGTPHGLGGL
jgi:subtilase family serine protease